MTATYEVPGRIARLPRDKHRRPVPWFVAWIDGVPDFRVIKPGAIGLAISAGCCWVCGGLFQRQEPRAYLIGPMCVVNRNTAEPPSHADCAGFSARACPFLTTPNMNRRDRHLPESLVEPPGIMLRRNPGVAAIWVAKYNATKIERQPRGGVLFRLTTPMFVEWFAYGRRANRAEVLASIDSGMPALRELADAEGPDARQYLAGAYEAALRWVPRA